MATEKRLIDANALGRDAFHVMCEGEYGEPCERCVVDWDDIETAPTVDAVQVKHGRWIWKNGKCFCSACSKQGEPKFVEPDGCVEEYPYCPNCGAKMGGDGNG